MKIVQNIHKVMQREAQRRDLYIFRPNEACYRSDECREINLPYLL